MLAYTLHDHVMKFDIGSPFFLVYSFNNMKIPIITVISANPKSVKKITISAQTTNDIIAVELII